MLFLIILFLYSSVLIPLYHFAWLAMNDLFVVLKISEGAIIWAFAQVCCMWVPNRGKHFLVGNMQVKHSLSQKNCQAYFQKSFRTLTDIQISHIKGAACFLRPDYITCTYVWIETDTSLSPSKVAIGIKSRNAEIAPCRKRIFIFGEPLSAMSHIILSPKSWSRYSNRCKLVT